MSPSGGSSSAAVVNSGNLNQAVDDILVEDILPNDKGDDVITELSGSGDGKMNKAKFALRKSQRHGIATK